MRRIFPFALSLVIAGLLVASSLNAQPAGENEALKIYSAEEICDIYENSETIQRYLAVTKMIHEDYYVTKDPSRYGVYDPYEIVKADAVVENFLLAPPARKGGYLLNNFYKNLDTRGEHKNPMLAWVESAIDKKNAAYKENFPGEWQTWSKIQYPAIAECASTLRGTESLRLFFQSGPHAAQKWGGCLSSGGLLCPKKEAATDCEMVISPDGSMSEKCSTEEPDLLDVTKQFGDLGYQNYYYRQYLAWMPLLPGGDAVLNNAGNQILDEWEKTIAVAINELESQEAATLAANERMLEEARAKEEAKRKAKMEEEARLASLPVLTAEFLEEFMGDRQRVNVIEDLDRSRPFNVQVNLRIDDYRLERNYSFKGLMTCFDQFDDAIARGVVTGMVLDFESAPLLYSEFSVLETGLGSKAQAVRTCKWDDVRIQ